MIVSLENWGSLVCACF